ncbi:MAG TPA: molybdate ABC transporter substrate-binding protein [Solirubrobacteraceae bacterium]
MSPRRPPLSLAWVALALLLPALSAGCGGGTELKVSAAASLRKALNAYAEEFHGASVHYSFAGSDTLAAQIQQGARPDVFASANTQLPSTLYAEGLTEKPVVFAGNRLVLAVPSSSHLRSLADAARHGVKISLGSPTAPVGAYSEKLIDRLPPTLRFELLSNVRDREPDVNGILGKLLEGAVDAALLYPTDVKAAGGRLRAIALPAELEPSVAYAVAVIKGTGHEADARAYVAGLLTGGGRARLMAAGFLPPNAVAAAPSGGR